MLGSALLLTTQIVLWHAYTGSEEQALRSIVKSYNEKQEARAVPGDEPIHVEAIAIPYGSMADKLQAAVPRGHGPDAFVFAHDVLGQWKQQGLLAPLEPLLPTREVLPELWPATVAPLQDGSTLWGLPLSFKSVALFYRTDLVEKPPATTDEILALCAKLRTESRVRGEPQRYGFAYEAGAFFGHAGWLHGFGGAIIPPGETEPRLDTPEQRRALHFVADLARRGDIPEEMTAVLVSQFFNSGRAAVIINGPWFIGEINPGVPYSVAPMPRVSATGRRAAPLTTIEAGFVSAKSPHPKAAADFLRFLAGPEGALARLTIGRQAVSEKTAWQHPSAQSDPVLRAFFSQLDDLVASPSHPGMRAFWEPGNQALRQTLRGGDPDQALVTAERLLRTYLKPPPAPARSEPYVAVLSALTLLGALWAIRRTQRENLLVQASKERSAYLYLLPAALAMTLLVLVPLFVGAGMSLFALLPDGSWRFVGFTNFADILLCREGGCFEPLSFYFTLVVTVVWTLANVSLHVLIGVGLALLLRDPLLRLRSVYRVLLILPWAIPNYITALIWKGMFNRQLGAVSAILSWLGLQPISWFSNFSTALAANIATNVWLGFPFMMVVALGHLAQIPHEVEEAAMLDGATRWQRLRHVVLPLLLPAMLPSVLLGAVWTFNMFNIVFLVSGGEPDGATDILVSQAYRWAFTRGHRYGYAAAYAVLIFLILLVQTTLLRRASERSATD